MNILLIISLLFFFSPLIQETGKGKFPEFSEREVGTKHLLNYNLEDLKIIRNEIFARHGYIFKDYELRNYFSQQAWYKPEFEDVTEKLTEIEKRNIINLKRFEEFLSRHTEKERLQIHTVVGKWNAKEGFLSDQGWDSFYLDIDGRMSRNFWFGSKFQKYTIDKTKIEVGHDGTWDICGDTIFFTIQTRVVDKIKKWKKDDIDGWTYPQPEKRITVKVSPIEKEKLVINKIDTVIFKRKTIHNTDIIDTVVELKTSKENYVKMVNGPYSDD
jgi:hypothetical protein